MSYTSLSPARPEPILNRLAVLDPVFRTMCDEPEGKIVRTVRPMLITPENLRIFWEKVRVHRAVCNTEVAGNFMKFVNIFLSVSDRNLLESKGLFWVIDDFVGIFFMTEITPGVDATLHFAFFDKRMKGRINLLKDFLRFVFTKYEFRRVTVKIPTYASTHVPYIVEKVLGFKYEGRRRSVSWFDGKWFDDKHYGMLREEFFTRNPDLEVISNE